MASSSRAASAVIAVALCASPFQAAGQSYQLPLRWIDHYGHRSAEAWAAAQRWNSLMGSPWMFQRGLGIGTEIRPRSGPFWLIPQCQSWGANELVNACVDGDRDIWMGNHLTGEAWSGTLLHEMGHTIPEGKPHHSGRGRMAGSSGTPTQCLTIDDYNWFCDWLWDYGYGDYCGYPNPEC